MKQSKIPFIALVASFFLLCNLGANADSPGQGQAATVETIVLLRHGEKPADDLGQLTFQGLNRALALPDVLIKKYGNANVIFAPSTKPVSKNGSSYYYVRPLMTVEPTAIRLRLPVQAGIGYDDINALQAVLLDPANQSSLVFVCWEHVKLTELAKNIIGSLGGDASMVPAWPKNDFDSIYVLKISTEYGKRSITFRHDQEGLDGQSVKEPEPEKN